MMLTSFASRPLASGASALLCSEEYASALLLSEEKRREETTAPLPSQGGGTQAATRKALLRQSHAANAKVTLAALPNPKSSVTSALPERYLEKRREELTSTTPYGVVAASAFRLSPGVAHKSPRGKHVVG